ncbi:hypothetical protein CF319_g7340 [Tilletia indica]|nr:hypothetical protein CF319_g7340 [Tilletia indica]
MPKQDRLRWTYHPHRFRLPVRHWTRWTQGRSHFKLTTEFIEVMGGTTSQGYRLFCELFIKGYLALRPYADDLVDACHLMLGTELPSFKGEPTIKRLRSRFRLDFDDRGAAKFALSLITTASENPRSILYDQFQYLPNRIPYDG